VGQELGGGLGGITEIARARQGREEEGKGA